MARPKIFLEATPLINKHLSGVGHVVLDTLRALDGEAFAAYDLRAFVPSDEYEKLLAYGFTRIKPVRLPYPHKFFSLFSRLRFAPPLDLFLGKGVYVFFNFRNWNLAASPSITYIHDVCFVLHPEFVQPKNRRFLQKYMTLWLQRTSLVAAVSETSRNEIEQHLGVDHSRTLTIRNTVNSELYRPSDANTIARIRQTYGLERDYFLFVGNIEPRKNLETLVDAFIDARGSANVTLFIIGGEGWLNEPVLAAIDDAKTRGFDIRRSTEFVPDEDVAILMSGARALVMPSWYEGFGLPALEALCISTPVIAADIPALREALAGNEASVSFFQPGDTAGLSSVIAAAITTEKPSLDKVIPRPWHDAARELLSAADSLRRKNE